MVCHNPGWLASYFASAECYKWNIKPYYNCKILFCNYLNRQIMSSKQVEVSSEIRKSLQFSNPYFLERTRLVMQVSLASNQSLSVRALDAIQQCVTCGLKFVNCDPFDKHAYIFYISDNGIGNSAYFADKDSCILYSVVAGYTTVPTS
jgi:hypothetical protein